MLPRKCKRCGSWNFFTEEKKLPNGGTHVGLYCGNCGLWIKFLNKQEIRVCKFRKYAKMR